MLCKICDKENPSNAKFYASCGTGIETEEAVDSSNNCLQCNECGTFNDLDAKYCIECGHSEFTEKTALDVMLAYTVFPKVPKL